MVLLCKFAVFFGAVAGILVNYAKSDPSSDRRYSIRSGSTVGLECDPTNPGERKAAEGSTNAYYYCSLSGKFVRRTCPKDRLFDQELLKCVYSVSNSTEGDNNTTFSADLLKQPFRQATGVCGNGVPFNQQGSPLVCNPSVTSCPAGYTCQAYPVTGIYYCCSGNNQATTCPFGTTPLLFNGQTQQCTIGGFNSCPAGYTCTNNGFGIGVCCSTGNTNNLNGCPAGQIPYNEPSTAQPRGCNPSQSFNACPPGFGCVLSTNIGNYQCCGQSFGCPFNTAGFINPQTGSYQTCSIGQSVCPANFQCLQSSTLGFAICCSSGGGSVINPLVQCQNGLSPLTTGTQAQQCSSFSPCPNGYTCTAVQGLSVCCPGASTVCNQPLSYGEVCTQTSPTARYYYNPNLGRCLRFIYNGCAGNSNNFQAQTQCDQFCSLAAVCPVGDPLLSATCSINVPCQTGYNCVTTSTGSYCCPNEGTVCAQPQNTGAGCTNPVIASRYFFNAQTGSCELFQYNGCGGNLNNFLNQATCENFCLTGMCQYGTPFRSGSANQICTPTSNTCPSQYSCQAPLYGPLNTQICCPTARTVCGQAVNLGTTCLSGNAATSTRYYFNSASNQCQQFQYSGCSGNDNNFRTLTECNSFCGVTICTAGNPLRDPSGNIQICSGSLSCPQANYQCTSSNIGTSGTSVCCPTAPYVCNLALNAGQPCSEAAVQLEQWYYSPATRQCAQFYYLGCGGNANRFQDLQTCTTFCGSANQGTCPNGLQPYIQPGTSFLQTCTINVPNTCPGGYSCVFSTAQQPVCCQGTASASCPVGQSPYIPPGSSQAQICQVGINTCPAGYFCTGTNTGISVCCGQGGSRTCPSFLPSNGQGCTINSVNGCPSNYICLPPVGTTTTQGTCCQANPACTNGGTPYRIPGGFNQAQVCSNSIGSCPASTTCSISTVAGVSICCQGGGSTGLTQCPAGQLPFLQPGTNVPQQCTPNGSGFSNCPANYFCTAGTTGQFLCCPGTLQCPSGYVAFLGTGQGSQPQRCSAIGGQSTCPQGYTCLGSVGASGTGLCCGSSSAVACANGLSAYVNPANQQKTFCNPQQASPCLSNYQCYASTLAGQFLCCRSQSSTVTCANGQAPYYIPATTTPQQCNTFQSNCPPGFSCQQTQAAGVSYCCSSGGTAGNLVNALCPYGFPYYQPGTTNKQPCSVAGLNTCPNGYGCTRAANMKVYLCCGGTSTTSYENCNNGGTPQILPGTTQRQTCTLQNPTCGNGFVCTPSTLSGTYVCCTPGTNGNGNGNGINPALNVCPTGMQALLTSTREPLECVPNLANNCAFSYTCTLSQSGNGKNYCCGNRREKNEKICPGDTEPYLTTAGLALACSTLKAERCPTGFLCQTAINSANSYCCSKAYCPFGQSVFVAPGRTAPETCRLNSFCPGTYSCKFSASLGQYYCCSTGARRSQNEITVGNLTSITTNGVEATRVTSFPRKASASNCPSGTVGMSGQCLPLYSPGQQGCTYSEQCGLRVPGAQCSNGFCVCPSYQMVHNLNCVLACPSGYINIAGRCTSFEGTLNSERVEEISKKKNGTIGGWCIKSSIPEQRCLAKQSTCNNHTLTCVCNDGYEIRGKDCSLIQNITVVPRETVPQHHQRSRDVQKPVIYGGGSSRFDYLTSLGFWYNKVSNFIRKNF